MKPGDPGFGLGFGIWDLGLGFFDDAHPAWCAAFNPNFSIR